MDITRYPLCWPNNVPRTRPTDRGYPNFSRKNRSVAIDYLLAEINRLNRRAWDVVDESVIISTNLKRGERGILGNQVDPLDVGVAVYFKLRFLRHTQRGLTEFFRPCVLTCDRWKEVSFNIDAIARDIFAQRARQRYGCTSVEQAFQGYLAIPERCGGASWWELLGVQPTATKDSIKEKFRELAKSQHPDKGGTHDNWVLLQEAFNQAMAA